MMPTIYMGYDSREDEAYRVAEFSLKRRASVPVTVQPIKIEKMREIGYIWRKTETRDGKLWDVVSEAPQSTEFAISRFLTPLLHRAKYGYAGWAIFVDCDVLFLDDVKNLFDLLESKYAVMCVKHNYVPSTKLKMDGQIQTFYNFKNWSSVMAFNCNHFANDCLDVGYINNKPGRDLHSFDWIKDHEKHIGALPPEWNALIGEPGYDLNTAKIAHYTLGGPWMGNSISREADALWLAERDAFVKSQAA
jgi:hypothetical protein